MKKKVIGIIGSGTESWAEYTTPLAEWIAEQNFHLLTGAGQGVMTSASKAFSQVKKRQGICLGIVPTKQDQKLGFVPQENYPNPWVEIAITSPLPTFDGSDANQVSRNYICVLSSDLLVALPGHKGTKNEISLAVRFQKPLILFAPATEMLDFPDQLPRTDSLEEIKQFIIQKL